MPIDMKAPSGLAGRVRGLEGRDGKFLTDQNINRKGEMIDHILANCWLETTDPGPYKSASTGAMNWGEALVGDRMAVLLAIHQAGNVDDEPYDFPIQCRNKACPDPSFHWELHLDELPQQDLSEAARLRLSAGENSFETVVPGTEDRKRLSQTDGAIVLEGQRDPLVVVPGTGTKVVFKLATGHDEKLARRRQKQDKKAKREVNEIIRSVRMRIVSVEGVEDRDLDEYLEGLGLPMLAKLIDRFDEQDCGVDTVVEVTCPECGAVQEHEIPFDEDFFFKRKRRVVK